MNVRPLSQQQVQSNHTNHNVVNETQASCTTAIQQVVCSALEHVVEFFNDIKQALNPQPPAYVRIPNEWHEAILKEQSETLPA